MKTSCVNHPPKEPLIIIREWQVRFCNGNRCAAALLSFYEYWHNIKLAISEKNKTANDIAEAHGCERNQDESLYQFHNQKELESGILGLYGKTKISESNKLLVRKGAISIHGNPNPRYKFDNTNYFLFHPDKINDWLKMDSRKPEMSNGEPDKSDSKPDISNGETQPSNGELKTDEQYTETTTKISSKTTKETSRKRRDCAGAQVSTKNERQTSIGETEPTEEGLLKNGVRKRTIEGEGTIEKRKRIKEGRWLDKKTFDRIKKERSKAENNSHAPGVQKSTIKSVASWNAKDWRLWLGEKFKQQIGVTSMELSGGGKNIARMHSRIKRFTDQMTEVSGYRQEDVKSYFDWWFDIKWEQIKKRDKGDMPSLTFSFMTAPSFVAEWQSVRGSVEERAREKHIANDYFAAAGNGVRS